MKTLAMRLLHRVTARRCYGRDSGVVIAAVDLERGASWATRRGATTVAFSCSLAVSHPLLSTPRMSVAPDAEGFQQVQSKRC